MIPVHGRRPPGTGGPTCCFAVLLGERCRLPTLTDHAVGDLVVAGADPATLAQAECIYILDPAATSLTGPYANACGAVAKSALPAIASTSTKLNASQIEGRIIGHTLEVEGAAFIFLAPGGSASLRSADSVYGPDQGSWRLQPDGGFVPAVAAHASRAGTVQ